MSRDTLYDAIFSTYLPKEVEKKIFGCVGPRTLSEVSLVSKEGKKLADFVYQKLHQKLMETKESTELAAHAYLGDVYRF
ncbi:MAG: hypothetical protein H0W88_12490 [Parachlamydiaceae bacterium]|nr:hypothetical protein [Parachlamydiaceae bacterium]